MAGEWREAKFVELCDISRGASPRPIQEWISEEGIPWVKISDASSAGSRYINNTKELIRFEGRSKSVSVQPGDLILSNSATPGIPMFMNIDACIHDGWLLLRHFRGLDKLFAYYLLINERPALVQQGNGSVFTNLKTDILKNHRVQLPDVPEQRAIAHILGTLDDKIELNRRMNETLEAIARAIFKSWFVDFDPVRAKASGESPKSICRRLGLTPDLLALFPDRLVESELGEIPEGWTVGTIADHCFLNAKSWTQRTLPAAVHYVDLANAKNGVVSQVQQFSASEAPSRARRILRAGDTIVGTVRPGNRSFALIGEELPTLTASTGFAVLTPRRIALRELVYFLATGEENISRVSRLADGAAYPAVRPEVVTAQACVVPPENVVNAFHYLVSAMVDRQLTNRAEATTLAGVRDSLLPGLISGELRVPLEGVA